MHLPVLTCRGCAARQPNPTLLPSNRPCRPCSLSTLDICTKLNRERCAIYCSCTWHTTFQPLLDLWEKHVPTADKSHAIEQSVFDSLRWAGWRGGESVYT